MRSINWIVAIVVLAGTMTAGCVSTEAPMGVSGEPWSIWMGHGTFDFDKTKTPGETSEGSWDVAELTTRTDKVGDWVLGPWFALEKNHGSTNTRYGWHEQKKKLGVNMNRGFDDWYDTVRLAWVKGEDSGHNATYRQDTTFETLEGYVATTYAQPGATWFSQWDISAFVCKELYARKQSFVGKKQLHDPPDSKGRWNADVAVDLYQVTWGHGMWRVSWAPRYGRSHWQYDGSDRNEFGFRARLTHRTKARDGQQWVLDVTPTWTTGDVKSTGGMIGFSYGF